MILFPTCCHQPLCRRGQVVQTSSTITDDCASAGAVHRTGHSQTQLHLLASCRVAREGTDTAQVLPTSQHKGQPADLHKNVFQK